MGRENKTKNKTTKLKELLLSADTKMIMEAHNGLSAKIVEEAGFEGIWASSLAISAAFGVRDCNEASWTQILDVIEFMSDATSIPILLDADTGYGNFNNVRRLVKKLEQRGIAGLCIEDKLFPKTNSFIGGERQPLADMQEFCGKIRAAKDSQSDPDFVVVARIESLIAGWGMDATVKRAEAYYSAGADALLIHSKSSSIDQVEKFMGIWKDRCPVIAVPTMYYQTRFETFQKLGLSIIIFANQMLRSCVNSMKKTAKKAFETKLLSSVEPEIVPVSEIFRLQNTNELRDAEAKYLPQTELAKGIILAASRGVEFEELTEDKPKTMIELEGKSILSRIQDVFNKCNIKDISVVLGYKPEAVKIENTKKIVIEDWEKSENGYSLYKAIEQLSGPVVISYGDIVFEERVLRDLMDMPEDIVLAVDYSWSNSSTERNVIIHVINQHPPSEMFGSVNYTQLKEIGLDIPQNESSGEWIGLMKLSSEGTEIVKRHLREMFGAEGSEDKFIKYSMIDFIKRLLENKERVFAKYFRGHWLDIDNKQDLKRFCAWKEAGNES